MKFLIDNQLPISLSKFLNEKGFESSHVFDLGMDSSKDIEIFRFAKANGYVLISKDGSLKMMTSSTYHYNMIMPLSLYG